MKHGELMVGGIVSEGLRDSSLSKIKELLPASNTPIEAGLSKGGTPL
jgi:hypothetical protein